MAVETKKPTTPEASATTYEVTLDTPMEKVIELDTLGVKVTFADDPGKFKRLSEDQLDKLSRITQAAYLVSERYHRAALDAAAHGRAVLGNIQQSARATDRLAVANKDPGWHYAWKRDDEYQRAIAYEGYVPANDEKLETFRKPVGGTPTVGTKGETELILLKTPNDLHERRLREASEKSRQRAEGVQKAAASSMGQLGFEEGDSRLDSKKRRWGEVSPPDEER